MKQPLLIALAATFVGVAGCHSHSTETAAPTKNNYTYAKSAPASYTSGDIVVVPMASTVADLSRPDVAVKSNAISVSGVVRLRSGAYNPDAVVRIVVIDRHGAEGEEIRTVLKETDTPGVLSYKALFGPVPVKGSSLAISYEDWQPVASYSSDYIGSGGGGGQASSSGTKGNTVVNSGSGTKTSKSTVGNSRGGGPLGGLSGPKFGK